MKKLAMLATVLLMGAAYMSGKALATNELTKSGNPVTYALHAFATTHARETGFEVHDWSTLSRQFESESTIRHEATVLAKGLGLTSLKHYEHIDAHDHVFLWSGTFHAANDPATATVEIASMRFIDAPSQTVLIERIVKNTTSQALVPLSYDAIRKSVLLAHGDLDINVMLFGSLSGQLSTSARAGIVLHVLSAVNATPVGTMTDSYTTSTSAYASGAAPSLLSGAQPVNLQVALHENSYKHDTRVLVGSPLITVEY